MLFTEWKVFRVPFLSLSFSVGFDVLFTTFHLSSAFPSVTNDFFFVVVALLNASQTSVNLSSKHTCERDIAISVL